MIDLSRTNFYPFNRFLAPHSALPFNLVLAGLGVMSRVVLAALQVEAAAAHSATSVRVLVGHLQRHGKEKHGERG